jgi:hypothetical protein
MNDPRIIYTTADGAVAVIVPAPEWLAQEGNTLEALAEKDVPPGATWQIVDAADVPQPEPPPPQPVTDVAFWQFMMAARRLGFVSMAEASAAVKQREMPASFAAAIAGLSEENQAEVRIKWAGITRMVRTDPLFALIVEAGIATDEQIDGVFAVAATIT